MTDLATTFQAMIDRPSGVAGLRWDAREKHPCPHCKAEPGKQCRSDEGEWAVVVHDARLDLALTDRLDSRQRWAYRVGFNAARKEACEAVAAIEEVQP